MLLDLDNYLEQNLLSINDILQTRLNNKINEQNLQYHFQNCFLDLFFVSSNSDFVLKHYETRSSELNKSFDKDSCFIDINKLINK